MDPIRVTIQVLATSPRNLARGSTLVDPGCHGVMSADVIGREAPLVLRPVDGVRPPLTIGLQARAELAAPYRVTTSFARMACALRLSSPVVLETNTVMKIIVGVDDSRAQARIHERTS